MRVDVYPEADKLGKQFKYASSRSVPFVAVVGDDERRDGKVSIKDLRSGDQHTVARSETAQFVTQCDHLVGHRVAIRGARVILMNRLVLLHFVATTT